MTEEQLNNQVLLVWHSGSTVRLYSVPLSLLPHPWGLVHHEYLWVEWNRSSQSLEASLVSTDLDQRAANKVLENLIILREHVDTQQPLISNGLNLQAFQFICVCGAKHGD